MSMSVTERKTRAARRTGRRTAVKKLIHSWQLYVLMALPLMYLIIFKYVPMYGAQIAFKNFIVTKGIWGS